MSRTVLDWPQIIAAGIDTDTVSRTPEGTWTCTRPDDEVHVVLAPAAGDWWTATAYADTDVLSTDRFRTVPELLAFAAAWTAPRASLAS